MDVHGYSLAQWHTSTFMAHWSEVACAHDLLGHLVHLVRVVLPSQVAAGASLDKANNHPISPEKSGGWLSTPSSFLALLGAYIIFKKKNEIDARLDISNIVMMLGSCERASDWLLYASEITSTQNLQWVSRIIYQFVDEFVVI